jgi:hypothetical protein
MTTALAHTEPPAAWVDCTPEEYHRPTGPPRLSQSLAHTIISRSPMHARRMLDREGDRDTASKDQGSIVHALLLGKGKGHVILTDPDGVPFKDRRTKAARETEAKARAAGLVPVLQHEAAPMLALATKIRDRLWEDFAIELDGESERAIHWTERAAVGTPVPCRGMLDHWHFERRTIYDLKIVKSAHPTACRRHVIEYGCDIQRAAYVRAVEQVHPELAGRVSFVLLFGEVGTGAVTPVHLRGEMAQIGALKWQRAIDTWARCLAADRWPAYVREPVTFYEAKPWERDDEMGAQGQSNAASFERPPTDDDETDTEGETDDE